MLKERSTDRYKNFFEQISTSDRTTFQSNTVILVIPLPIFNENIKEIKLSTLASIYSIFTNRRSYNTILLFQTRRIFEIGSFPRAVHIPVNTVEVRYIFESHSESAVQQLRSIKTDYKRLRRLAS